ncbi:MAG: ABC transporter permease subunit [Betaproteobacteria bacterium]|nr:ABC transporter permease subunit [Betaproteobacteria bacterium]
MSGGQSILERPAAGFTLGARRLLASPLALKATAGIVLLGAWEGIVRALAPAYVAKPTGIARVFFTVIANEQFLAAAGATLGAVVKGLVIAIMLGTAIGLAMGRITVVERGLRYYVNSLFATPMIAVLPLVTLWFGYNADARLAVIVFAAFFSIAVNTCDGARSVPLEFLEVARSFRARPLSTLLDIVLPSSLPYLIAGMRLAAGRALVAAVVAEFFISIPGLGYYILFNSRTFKHNEAFVAVIALVAVGVSFEAMLNWVTRRYLPWARRD